MSNTATKRIALTRTAERASSTSGRPPIAAKPRRSVSDRLFMIWGILVLLFLFAPIIVILVYSFNTGRLLIAFDGFGIEPFLTILNKPAIQNAVWVSIRSGVFSALFATAIGTLAGVAMARRPGKWVGWFLALLVLVTVTPEIVDAVSLLPWVVFLGQDLGLGIFNDGIFRLVVGNSLFSIAVVSYIVRARLVGISESLEEASADLYAPPLRTFWRITLPLAMPAVLAGGLLSFTLSLDNTIVSSFVSVSGTTPWPVYVLSAVRSGLRPEIASVSTLMLIVTLLALALVAWVLKRSGDSATEIARTMAGG
ncbi:MAG: ABC transporter permease [Cryobacterium sp.]|nr:ABC transporter permease [Cryobacterium sp.]